MTNDQTGDIGLQQKNHFETDDSVLTTIVFRVFLPELSPTKHVGRVSFASIVAC